MPQWDAEEHTKHFFADGLYCRSLWRPAGTCIIGKIHKKEHLYIVVFGTIRLVYEDGKHRDITGPEIIIAAPASQKVVLALTDALCLTIHNSNSKDVETAEQELVEPWDGKALYGPGNKLLERMLK